MISQLSEPSAGDIETQSPTLRRGEVADQTADEFDELFRVLNNATRRFIMHYLAKHDEPVSVDALAAHTHESPNINTESHEIVKANIQHRHLPEIEKAGYVEFDAEANRVVPSIANARVTFLLDYVAEESDWNSLCTI